MNSKAKGVVALILAVAVLANVGIFAKMSYNKTHTAQETIVFRVGDTVASDHPISQALYIFIDSFWAILSPVIILGGIYSGFFTPTEAAAVSCVYTFIIGTFVYKEIHWKEFVDCMKDTVVIAGATSFIVGMSTSFAYVMTLEQVPETLSAFILGISNNKTIILLLMNIFLLVVGMFMDNISSCTILAPILLPVAVALGVNPVHFGIVMTMNLAVGFITPPYGVNLFVGSSVAHIPFERIVKWIWPFIGVIIAVLLLTTYIPQLSLLLV